MDECKEEARLTQRKRNIFMLLQGGKIFRKVEVDAYLDSLSYLLYLQGVLILFFLYSHIIPIYIIRALWVERQAQTTNQTASLATEILSYRAQARLCTAATGNFLSVCIVYGSVHRKVVCLFSSWQWAVNFQPDPADTFLGACKVAESA